MASTDGTDLATLACGRGRHDASKSEHLALALDYINEAYLLVCDGDEPWDFLIAEGQFTVSSSADTYTLSSIASSLSVTNGIRDVYDLTNDSKGGDLLVPGSWRRLEQYSYTSQDSDPSGQPTHWAQWGRGGTGKIRFYPKPDTTYTIGCRYRKAVAEIGGSDFPDMPTAFRKSVLVPYAESRLWRKHSGREALAMAQAEDDAYERALARMTMAYASAQEPELTFADESMLEPVPWRDPYIGGGWY